jgi:hypothetical protein
MFSLLTKKNHHKVFLYAKNHHNFFFSFCFSNQSPNVATLTVVFSHEQYSQRRLVLLLSPRISKQASWRQQQRQFQKPFLKPVSSGEKTLKKQKLGLLAFHEENTAGI